MKQAGWIAAAVVLAALGLVAWRQWPTDAGVSADAGVRHDDRRRSAFDPRPLTAGGGASGATADGWSRPPGQRRPAAGDADRTPDGARPRPGAAALPLPDRSRLRVEAGNLPRRAPPAAGAAPLAGDDGDERDPNRVADVAQRAAALPDAKQHRQTVSEADAVPPQDPNADPDLLLSMHFDGEPNVDAGVPPQSADGVEVHDDGATFGDKAVMTFAAAGNVNGDAGSIALSVTPDWAGSDAGGQAFVQILSGDHVWENRIAIGKDSGSLRFILVDNTGVERNVGIEIPDWQPGQTHQVTATWGDALMSLYVDGRQVGQNTYAGTLQVPPSGPIYLGSNRSDVNYNGVGGRVTDFKIFGRALGADEVGK
ncbi:MAG: LamG domain-containing protein [bacterium]